MKNKGAKYKSFAINNLNGLERYFIYKYITYTDWKEVGSYERELRFNREEVSKKQLKELFKTYNLKYSKADAYIFYEV